MAAIFTNRTWTTIRILGLSRISRFLQNFLFIHYQTTAVFFSLHGQRQVLFPQAKVFFLYLPGEEPHHSALRNFIIMPIKPGLQITIRIFCAMYRGIMESFLLKGTSHLSYHLQFTLIKAYSSTSILFSL